jgi:cell division septation protein DedD
MEDQTSWKGHSFTLLVFTGIVVLCSIFFILGMLVGRAQAQKLASNASAGTGFKVEARPAPKEENKPDLTFYDSVKKSEPPSLEPPPPKTEPIIPDTPSAPEREGVAETRPAAAPAPAPANVLNYQIAALRKSSDAEKLVDELKKKGFRAFILAPASDDANPYFRVQVGPFTDMLEAEEAKKKLESANYQPILKK